MAKFVFTCGDINGIGPEIVIKTLNKIAGKKNNRFYFICPENVFKNITSQIKPVFNYSRSQKDGNVTIIFLKSFPQAIGRPTKASGNASFLALKKSFELLKNKIADAVITAPVSKTALNKAGVIYPGQTEMYADWAGEKEYAMCFLSDKLNVALSSIHIPLNRVSKSLNKKNLEDKIKLISNMLLQDLGIDKPSIAVLGLNPHAGEGGLIGTEEKEIIIPAIKNISKTVNAAGPFSADAFFARRLYKNFDIVLAMYHDQGLIPFKHINFGGGVNFTAGLPFVRTSPDHGVAYDIAGRNIADESSIIKAFNYAKLIVKNRKKH